MIVKERVRPTEPAQPPAEKRRYAKGDEAERAWRRRVRRERPDGGALEDSAKGRAEHLISGAAISIMVHERMNEADNRESRASSVGDRCLATISVPAEDAAGEVEAAQGVLARRKLHAPRWHMEDICSARIIEHVRPLEEARKRLAVLAVADETESGLWRNFVCQACTMMGHSRDSLSESRTSCRSPFGAAA
jgi:hypothetical protein